MAAIKGSAIEPLSLDCTKSTTDLKNVAVTNMESEPQIMWHTSYCYILTTHAQRWGLSVSVCLLC